MWAPFLYIEDGVSRVNAESWYINRLHGFERARSEHWCGWVPVRVLDDKATAAHHDKAVAVYIRCRFIGSSRFVDAHLRFH